MEKLESEDEILEQRVEKIEEILGGMFSAHTADAGGNTGTV